ncbi:hypothetical protein [Umezawaea sp.]|uniref:hypothetical protein n=1 Tax=Umezawaea sp. TaxID=1955258 RepID=UPI002ED34080
MAWLVPACQFSRLIRRITPILRWRPKDFGLDLLVTALLVDGTLIPIGHRLGRPELRSGRRHRSGMTVQVAADLAGRVITASCPVSGRNCDLEAFRAWACPTDWTPATPSRTRATRVRA